MKIYCHNSTFCLLFENILLMFRTDLEDTTVVLDFRVTALEENGGGDGNSSVA